MGDNPKTALDTILAAENTTANMKIYPMTIARYALLELVGSPLISNKEFDI